MPLLLDLRASLRRGGSVEIINLRKFPLLNGKTGKLGKFDNASSRWEVQIPDMASKLIKSENLKPLGSLSGRKKRLCRYGQACYRPECWFEHGDAVARCGHFAELWQQMLDVDMTPHGGLDSDALASHADVCSQLTTMRSLAEAKGDRLEKSMQQITELRASVATLGERLSALDVGESPTAKAEQFELDLMDLTDLTASQHVELQASVGSKIEELADITSSNYAALERRMDAFVDENESYSKQSASIPYVEQRIGGVEESIHGLVQAAMQAAFVPLVKHVEGKLDDFDKRFQTCV